MNALHLLAASTATRLNPVQLFLEADSVVQLVMAALLLASVSVWAIVFSVSLRLRALRKRSDAFELEFWRSRSPAGHIDDAGEKSRSDNPLARIASAGQGEWRRTLASSGASRAAGRTLDHEGARQRFSIILDSAVAQEADRLAERLNFLATVGAVAPFVGLFGTGWGIMNSFFQIGQQQNTSLAVVAPGISEALFATAIGLFAAIPAVIAYNRLSQQVGQFEARMQRFADRYHAQLSRDLEAV